MNRPATGDIATLLSDVVGAHGVAGASLAVVVDGEVTEFAAGVADCRTHEPMRPDTLCLIGSTTKVYTATLLMQLVATGRVSLDAPVRRYLSDFRLADPDAAAALTVRHLLTHSTGIGVGSYADHGCADDAVARYVASLAGQPSVHHPGERWGYSNAAYIIAGRIVEVVTDLPWDVALRRHLLGPAGLLLSGTSPEDRRLLHVSRSHLRHADGRLEVVGDGDSCGRSRGPTGATLATSAGDLARFALLHLNKGVAQSGSRVLEADTVAAMQGRQTSVLDGWPHGDGWCLGWLAGTWGDRQMIGHIGHSTGSGSHLAVLPEVGGALALVFNTVPGDANVAHELFATLGRELFGARKPAPWLPNPGRALTDLAPMAGSYVNDLGTLVVDARDDALLLTSTTPALVDTEPYVPITATAFGSGVLGAHAAAPPDGFITPEIFFDGFDAVGTPAFLYRSVFPFRRQA